MSAIRGGDNDERGDNKVLKIDPILFSPYTRAIIRDRIESSSINRSIDRNEILYFVVIERCSIRRSRLIIDPDHPLLR